MGKKSKLSKNNEKSEESKKFLEDDAICKNEKKRVNKADKVDKLVEWKPDDGDSDSEKYKLDGSAGWDVKDMYAQNEQLGWRSTYDPTSREYTNAEVRRNNETHDQRMAREKRATQKAREIEGSADYQKAIAHELDETMDEEEKFSSVQRGRGGNNGNQNFNPRNNRDMERFGRNNNYRNDNYRNDNNSYIRP